MAQIQAVQCDACDRIDKQAEGTSAPYGWLLVDIEQDENRVINGGVYCSWACLADVSQHRAAPPKQKRKRRTRAEIDAEIAAIPRADTGQP